MYAHPNHIPQPPHTAGQGFKGLRPRIEPDQIPSPTEVIEADRQYWADRPFTTLSSEQQRIHVPVSTTDYAAIDQGNSSPKYVRMSTWALPYTSRLASDCAIPITAMIQPFADLDPREELVPVIETGPSGPARCEKCLSYVNAWCHWVEGGNKWKCNLCKHETQVTSEYFSNLGSNGLRLDHMNRPELMHGTVDFDVTDSEIYWASNPPSHISRPFFSIEEPAHGPRKPELLRYMFVLDVSVEAIQSGFVFEACSSLLASLSTNGYPPGAEMAVMTFDSELHFYDLSSDQVPMLVVSDLDDVFLPIPQGMFLNPAEHLDRFQTLLTVLPTRFADTTSTQSALGPALHATLAALAGRGGLVVLFQSTMPNHGPGALPSQPTEMDLYDTDKERTLYQPRDALWRDIAESCAEEGIGLSMFLGMSKYIDVGSLAIVASATGGELFFHPRFDPQRDGDALRSQLHRLLMRTTAYNCSVKVRCSTGLQIKEYLGNFHSQSTTEIDLGSCDADKTFSAVLEHNGKLNPRENAHLQCAVLYTTTDGRRRVRLCNLAVQIVELAGNVFRYADLDAVVSHFARKAITNMSRQKMSVVRDTLTESCAAVLLGYRTQCAGASRPSQLILPESFKTLPVYTLAIHKAKPMKARSVSSDVRNYMAHKMLAMSVRTTLQHIYPRILALHDLDDNIALPDANGTIAMPSIMRNSYVFMSADGIYLADNEEAMILWVGTSVPPKVLEDLFGVDDIALIDPRMSALPELQTRLSAQVRNILAHRYQQRGRIPKLYIARQNFDGAEIEFSDMLVEDQNNGTMSYLDYLTIVHRQISHVLTEGGSLGGEKSMRSPW